MRNWAGLAISIKLPRNFIVYRKPAEKDVKETSNKPKSCIANAEGPQKVWDH